MLISALTPHLLAVANPDADPNISKIDICVSLRALSAKFWIQEIPSLLVSPTVDLEVEPWRSEAQSGVQLACWGVSAPEATKFHVKGALLDPYGTRSHRPARSRATATFTTMVSHRMSLAPTADWPGHASAEMNAHYTHHEIETLRSAIGKLPTVRP